MTSMTTGRAVARHWETISTSVHLGAVDLGQVRLAVAGGHPAGYLQPQLRCL
jgi:hypothetical protein